MKHPAVAIDLCPIVQPLHDGSVIVLDTEILPVGEPILDDGLLGPHVHFTTLKEQISRPSEEVITLSPALLVSFDEKAVGISARGAENSPLCYVRMFLLVPRQ